MTRRGSLVYYLTAWVCGCLFMTLGVWLLGAWESTHWAPGFRGTSGFLAFYFLGLIFGAFTLLLFAFLLRRLMRLLGWEHPWQWFLVGGGLAWLLVWGLGALRRVAEPALSPVEFALIFLLGAPSAIHPRLVWVALPVGAATAFVLHLIHRAFEAAPDAAQAGSPKL